MRRYKKKYTIDKVNNSSNEIFKSSKLYLELLAEHNEILKHKWIESEKKGTDLGMNTALHDWIRKHRKHWVNMRKQDR